MFQTVASFLNQSPRLRVLLFFFFKLLCLLEYMTYSSVISLHLGWNEGSACVQSSILNQSPRQLTFKKLFYFYIISDLQKFQNRRKNSQLCYTHISQILTFYYILLCLLCVCMYAHCTYIMKHLRVSCSDITENDRIGNSKKIYIYPSTKAMIKQKKTVRINLFWNSGIYLTIP